MHIEVHCMPDRVGRIKIEPYVRTYVRLNLDSANPVRHAMHFNVHRHF